MISPEPTTHAWRKSSHSATDNGCVEVAWRKSSYSTDNGDCVEVGWRKSSYSTDNGGCVEVAWRAPEARIRDSKAPGRGALAVEHARWHDFLAAIR